MRYLLDISYDGTAYAGWQVQPNANTVQAELDKGLTTILRTPVQSVGAGRTDAGVHGRQLLVHFDHEDALPDRFQFRLNGFLPNDVSVNGVFRPHKPDFHVRFDAISRSYVYQITSKKSPFLFPYALWTTYPLDIEAMNRAAKMLLEYDSFASFCKAHGANKTYLCVMHHAYWEVKGDLLLFHIKANRFLRGMVRAVVGTLLWVGRGKITESDFRKIIEKQDRKAAGPNAPAKGLFLTEVAYPSDSWEKVI